MCRLTKKQVENSPDINTREPVSRQHEASYLGYYGYGDYWGGPYIWGPAFYPGNLAIPPAVATQATADRIRDGFSQFAPAQQRRRNRLLH